MAQLGSSKTKKFRIGTAELRVGPLNMANKLTQAHSVGLLDNVTVEVSQESVDLLGGFPKKLVDTAIVSQEATLTASLREYSGRNINAMLGNGITTSPVDVASTLASDAASGATSITVQAGDGANFTVGDLVVLYPTGQAENVSVCQVASIAVDTLTLVTTTPTLFAYTAADVVHVYVAHQVAIGNVEQTNYFSVQVLQAENSTGRPVGFNFWKGAISTGMTYGTNADDFASTEFGIKLLEPAASEYGAGADLEHLAGIIPSHATGMFFSGGDDV